MSVLQFRSEVFPELPELKEDRSKPGPSDGLVLTPSGSPSALTLMILHPVFKNGIYMHAH